MAKTKKTPRSSVPTRPVSSAAKNPTETAKFLNTIDAAMTTFDDAVTSILPDERDLAYEHLATSYREALNDMWSKSQQVDIVAILNSVKDKHLTELQKLKWLMTGSKDQPKVVKENRQVPELAQILGAMTSKLPQKDMPNKETRTKISNVFSDLAGAHRLQAKATKGLTELAETVSPEQLTLILAAAVPPALQLALPPGSISPMSVPPPPPPVMSTGAGRSDLIAYCKCQILPNATATSIPEVCKKAPNKSPYSRFIYKNRATIFHRENGKSGSSSDVLCDHEPTDKSRVGYRLQGRATYI